MKRVITVLNRVEDSLLIALLLSMILLAGYDIVARTLFGGGVSWIPPLLRNMVLWLGLLGALLATRTREHIAIDLINRLAGDKVKRILSVITQAFAAVICGLIGWFSAQYIGLAREFGDIAFADIPSWPLQLIIPISFSLMALRFAAQSIQSVFTDEELSVPPQPIDSETGQ
ncbi:MAG: TRAP transporter small permease [Oleibacter sp.]|nr:TRAP transporter small permease [Thalassolituus sp.]